MTDRAKKDAMNLPIFKYHPNPIQTRAVVETDEPCECCGQARGYKYNSVIYAVDEVETICPWCISDGSASQKFDGMFLDDHSLRRADLPDAVIEEVCKRTPGYNSWQQQVWQAHCGDACEFHGNASEDEILKLEGKNLAEFLHREKIRLEIWPEIRDLYLPGGDPSIFKFICRKCSQIIYTMDFR